MTRFHTILYHIPNHYVEPLSFSALSDSFLFKMPRLLMLTNVHLRSQATNAHHLTVSRYLFTHWHLRDEFLSMGGHECTVPVYNLPMYKRRLGHGTC
jgi:hypothetical protein